MIIFPKGKLKTHLMQNGKWWLVFFIVDVQALDEQVKHAKKHHPEEDADALRERALFRMGARKTFPWKAAAITLLALLIASRAMGQSQEAIVHQNGTTRTAPLPVTCVTGCGGSSSNATIVSPLDVSGNVKVAIQNATIAVTQSTSPWVVSGTVTANQGGTWTVQPGNTANTTAWKVDGSAVTQPVSGTVTANISGSISNTSFTATQATGTNLHTVVDSAPTTAVTGTFWQSTQPVSIASMPSTPVTGTFWQSTQPVSAVALPLPSGASTDTKQDTGNASLSSIDGKLPGDLCCHGQQPVTGTAAALATHTTKKACVKALSANTINIFVGDASVTTSNGFELTPGSAICLPVTNTNKLYVVASTTGANAAWLATN